MATLKCVEKVRKIGPTLYLAVRKSVAKEMGIAKGDLVEFSIIGKAKKNEDWEKWTY